MFVMVAYKTTNPELIEWLSERLDERNLSQSEASRRAGLGLNAISEVMNGRTPGMKVCNALADLFGVPVDHVMRLAGHLPPLPDGEDPDAQPFLRQVAAIHSRAKAKSPEQAQRLREVVILQMETLLAAMEAIEKETELM